MDDKTIIQHYWERDERAISETAEKYGAFCFSIAENILHNREELGVPLSLGLGASLDFEAGNIKRAPKWMSDHGLEWLYRLTQEPKRLAKRYLVDDTKILGMAIKYRKVSK